MVTARYGLMRLMRLMPRMPTRNSLNAGLHRVVPRSEHGDGTSQRIKILGKVVQSV
jgi:hypothetical protein